MWWDGDGGVFEKIMANYKAEFGVSMCYSEVEAGLEYGVSDRRSRDKRSYLPQCRRGCEL